MKNISTALWVAVALAGAAIGFWSYRQHDQRRETPVKMPAVTVATGPAAAPASPALKIPERVPDIQLPDMTGRMRSLRDASGNPHLYNFWATWCEPCRREIPLLNTLQHTYRADHLAVVGIAIDFSDAVRDFLKTTPLHYTSLVGEEAGLEAAQKFGMDVGLPFSVFADDRDQIIALKVGELHRDEAEAILATMRSLKGGELTLPAARAAIARALEQLSVARAKQ